MPNTARATATSTLIQILRCIVPWSCAGSAGEPDQAALRGSPAAALAANESQLRDMLRLSRVSMASSGVDSCEDVDPELMCPICMVCAKHARPSRWCKLNDEEPAGDSLALVSHAADCRTA
jgi:hypothetical protein